MTRTINKKNRMLCIKAFLGRARVQRLVGETAHAIRDTETGIRLSKSISTKSQEGHCLLELSNICGATGKYSEMNNAAEASLNIYSDLTHTKGIAESYQNIGKFHSFQSRHRKALDFFKKALALQNRARDCRGQASSHLNIGLSLYELGNYEEALEQHNTALKLYGKVDDIQGQANAYSAIGFVYFHLGQYENAIEQYKKALHIRKIIGDHRGHAFNLAHIGIVYYTIDEYNKALEYLSPALGMLERIGDIKSSGNVLFYFGNIYVYFGEYSKARDYYERALAIAKEIGDLQGEAYNKTGIGTVHFYLGEHHKALILHLQALGIVDGTGDRHGQSCILLDICGVYLEQGKIVLAKENLKRGHAVASAIGHKDNLCLAERLWAEMALSEHNLAEAKEHIDKAMDINRLIKADRKMVRNIMLQGRLETAKENWQNAEKLFKEALVLCKGKRYPQENAEIHYHYGILEKVRGRSISANKLVAKAKQLFKRLEALAWLEKTEQIKECAKNSKN